MTTIRNNEADPSHVTHLDELCLSLSVKTEKEAFQVLSPELVICIPCKKTPVAMISGVYNETEINDTEEQCVVHGYGFGDYSRRAIQKKKTSDASVKVQKPSSSTKKENRYKTTRTEMTVSNDADFMLRST